MSSVHRIFSYEKNEYNHNHDTYNTVEQMRAADLRRQHAKRSFVFDSNASTNR